MSFKERILKKKYSKEEIEDILLREGVRDEFGLSEEEYDSLLIVYRAGHFETPSKATYKELEEIAGTTHSKLQRNVNSATNKILEYIFK